jgi:hypothetical protein
MRGACDVFEAENYIYCIYVNILWGRERTLYTYFVDREPEGREYKLK